MKLFDTHCHLAGTEMFPTYMTFVDRAHQGGIRGLAIVSAEMFSLERVLSLQKDIQAKYPDMNVVVTAGLHPHEAEKIDEASWQAVLKVSQHAQAIGETGLDYFYEHSPREVQIEYFRKHIELAAAQKKPLVIHCREAANDVLKNLDCAAIQGHPNPGILHCFTETKEVAQKLLDWNFFISFSGIVTFKNAEALREAAKIVPIEKILIETDSPWLAPIPHRGKKNEPLFVTHTFNFICELKKLDREEFSEQLWRNSCKVYGIEP